jgi:hypothetical protein
LFSVMSGMEVTKRTLLSRNRVCGPVAPAPIRPGYTQRARDTAFGQPDRHGPLPSRPRWRSGRQGPTQPALPSRRGAYSTARFLLLSIRTPHSGPPRFLLLSQPGRRSSQLAAVPPPGSGYSAPTARGHWTARGIQRVRGVIPGRTGKAFPRVALPSSETGQLFTPAQLPGLLVQAPLDEVELEFRAGQRRGRRRADTYPPGLALPGRRRA